MKLFPKSTLALVSLIILTVILPADAVANEAQARYAAIGNRFGIVQAIFELHGKINGNSALSADHASLVATNLKQTVELIDSVERLSNPGFDADRRSGIEGVKRRINMFDTNTRSYSIQQKTAYLRQTAYTYKTTLMRTAMSARNDVVQQRLNCDSAYFEFGYELGKAEFAATIPTDKRRIGDVDNYQQSAFGGVINAIDEGLRLSSAGYSAGRESDNTEKICCPFGKAADWDGFKSSLRWYSGFNEMIAAFDKRYNEIRVDDLGPNGCGGTRSTDELGEYYWLVGRWRYFNFLNARTSCILTLTDTTGSHGFVATGCGRSESFWQVKNGRLLIISDSGTVSADLATVSKDRFLGQVKVFMDRSAGGSTFRGDKMP